MNKVKVTLSPELTEVLVGVVYGANCSVGPSAEGLQRELDAAIGKAKQRNDDEAVRASARNMLRYKSYKPTGRGKPASEYLLSAAREDKFPRINNLVDINNIASLESLLPISILDIERAKSRSFIARRGRSGESYVFNSSGQSIDLCDLLLVASLPEDIPRVNAVKDSMDTKVNEETKEVLVVIYAPESLRQLLSTTVARFASLLQMYAGASEVETKIVQPQ